MTEIKLLYSSSSSLCNIVGSIQIHLHSICYHSGIQNNINDNDNNNINNDFEVESELVKINEQLRELDNFIKSKYQDVLKVK